MTTREQDCFMLFACCIPVRGFQKSIIVDLQREQYLPIPNLLADILIIHRGQTISGIKAHFNHQYDEGIDLFFQRLIEAEWGFITDEPERYPLLSMDWDHPSRITNAVIDIENTTNYFVPGALTQLENLGCKALQIRCFESINTKDLDLWLNELAESRLFSIELLLPNQGVDYEGEIKHLIKKHNRIASVILFRSDEEGYDENEDVLVKDVLYKSKAVIYPDSLDICDSHSFVTNIHAFTEAQSHNLGLNRKVCIDVNGNIKNFPSHAQSFGNVANDDIASIIQSEAFQAVWSLNHDKIEKCKDCEFRYICPDMSEIKEIDGKYYKVNQCKYDPYSGEWKEREDVVQIPV